MQSRLQRSCSAVIHRHADRGSDRRVTICDKVGCSSGAYRARTGDLLLAKQALSQLS